MNVLGEVIQRGAFAIDAERAILVTEIFFQKSFGRAQQPETVKYRLNMIKKNKDPRSYLHSLSDCLSCVNNCEELYLFNLSSAVQMFVSHLFIQIKNGRRIRLLDWILKMFAE